ncbi:hypothetical protein AUR64_06190 [Haloprofundus marisrubri]|uniref:DUF502 domain-containing protein n=1 Tax=Haloprofundus marisrubri TaxID=1514971 RepID=A0A0W1RCC3_9EURY|nr:DUF502 domain-containing protein [Haloprofundus marisrubri]KTG10777.1 hypothetical protein AUR64_06190 [Haloprofundus marisrubri]
MSTWKRDFASGLVVLTPLLVILLVLNWFYQQIADLPIIEYLVGQIESEAVAVLTILIIFLMLVFSVGYLMRTTFGRLVEDGIDAAMNQVPLIRVLYNASKLAVETALTGTEELQTPVRIETWNGLRMTAFKTGKRTDDGRVVLFLPTAPNITSGFVIEVEEERVEEIDERVEEALTRILSAGFAEESDPGIDIDVIDEMSVDDIKRTNDD